LTVAVAVAVTVADIGAANAAVGDGAADMEFSRLTAAG
jgi:hypothetical protein